ncbi:hypothetical protein DDZ13_11815 [Coraliomargarita sinensis]|uniref:Xylose isomerase n=1 Tax=Coraliomargarita sinensis TaxID=2174842 RepID=A0A317ZDQ8_9BACT|nr:metabolite traffic protein EboE [Coraliomargarita sinensis]PXA03376.1 hypothetical protein DDZ13_11815 [Coraliomargarita sinensis]
MRFDENIHLGYSTNIHRGNSWEETFAGLRDYTLQVKDAVCPEGVPYGIGLRLSHEASLELAEGDRLTEFRRWLEANNCYVFTINGFPYGNFHGTRVKEQVYVPDWQTQARLDYTKRLFDLLAQLLPEGVEGSISTVPCSFKSFIQTPAEVEAMQAKLIECAEYIEELSDRSGRDLHLGLEPEPFGYLETTPETIDFFKSLCTAAPDAGLIRRRIGVNYDTCHMAIQFENAAESLAALADEKIRISKLHLSSALSVRPTEAARVYLKDFVDSVYLHQVVSRDPGGAMTRWEDLDQALDAPASRTGEDNEWRVHFHVPLYAEPEEIMGTTVGHLEDTLDFVAKHRSVCNHFEFETYTWEVLPAHLRTDSVVEQLIAEYKWCFDAFTKRSISLS